MKKLNLDRCIIGIFLLLVGLNIINHSDFTLDPTSSLNHSSPHIIKASGVPEGYYEANFTLIIVQEKDIMLASEVIVNEAGTFIDCYTNLSSYVNTSSTLWHIKFPETYVDASNYKIQRTETEIYHCFYDDSHTGKYIGTDTYWNYVATELTKDVLRFTVQAPVALIDEVLPKRNTTNIEYTLMISRTLNTQRTYSNVIFDEYFEYPFDGEYDIQILDETGGVSFIEDITKNVHLLIDTTGENLHIRFLLGTILSNTDYQFRIRFYKITLPASFFDDWFVYILLPTIVAIVAGLVLYPEVMVRINKKFARLNRWEMKNIIRYGLPFILVLEVITELIMYLSWRNTTGVGAYFAHF